MLFVRHGESEGNLRSARMAIKFAKGEIRSLEDAKRYRAEERSTLERSEASGDTRLSRTSRGGEAQARMLSDYWAEILQEKSNAGELIVYVSPMLRCLQTADPIVRRLGATAVVRGDVFEVPGLCAREDQEYMEREIFPYLESDLSVRLNGVLTKMKSHSFRRCGMTRDEIRSRFPWVRRFERLPKEERVRWWPGGYESETETTQRVQNVRRWLLDLAKIRSSNDVVVVVSHGEFIWRVCCALLKMDVTGHSLQNTSVTHVSIDEKGGVACKFVNRTPHLLAAKNDAIHRSFYRFQNLMKRKMRKGTRQIDLTELMLQTTRRLKPLLSRL